MFMGVMYFAYFPYVDLAWKENIGTLCKVPIGEGLAVAE